MQERRLRVERSARWYLLGEAAGAHTLWVACHGYGQLAAEFAPALEPLLAPGVAVVVPEAPLRFYIDPPGAGPASDRRVGASWMTREDREADIADYVRLLDAVLEDARGQVSRAGGGPEPEIRLLGFSQGVATVCRWVAFGAVRPTELVLWAGPVPPDLELAGHAEAFRRPRITLVRGSRDRQVNEGTMGWAEARLQGVGAVPRRVTFPGGHRLDRETLGRLAAGAAEGEAAAS